MDKELSIKIKALVQGAKDVAKLAEEVGHLGAEGRKPIPDNTRELREGAKLTKGAISDLTRELTGLVTAGAIIKFANDSINEFSKMESAFRGLEAVANASGYGIGRALEEADKLAADGLISVAEAAKALQNLLARGYSIDQAVNTLERLKDSAAFNRAAHLSMGEAVVTASEGLKNENSILVDNAGVTQNVAKMWELYAKQLGITVNDMTQAQKIEAEYQGIMRETAAQVGNSEKALAGYQGQMAEANQETLKFQQQMGELLAPVKLAAAQLGNTLLQAFKLVAVGAGAAAIGVGFLARSIKILLLDPLGDIPGNLAREWDAAKDAYDEFGRNILDGNSEVKNSLSGVADAQKIADNQMKNSAKSNAEEQKKLIDKRIKDYERLRDAIRSAWQDSIKAEKDYLAEAKKLRQEANAFDPKSLAGASPQEVATKEIDLKGDLRIAEERLRRLASEGGSLDQVRAQAEEVQRLADQYRSLTDAVEDQAYQAEISQRADEAVKASKLELAKALESAAAEEQQRQQDQIKVLGDVEKILADLQTQKTVNVDATQAKTELDEVKAKLDGIQDKTVTITVKKIDAANAQNFTGVYDSLGNAVYLDPNTGGATGHYAGGGPIIGPGPKGVDSVLGVFAPNEHVWTSAETDAVGGHAAMYRLRALARAGLLRNALSGMSFDVGGQIGAARSSRSALSRVAIPNLTSTAAPASMQTISITLPGIGTYAMQGSKDTADSLVKSLRREALKRGNRK